MNFFKLLCTVRVFRKIISNLFQPVPLAISTPGKETSASRLLCGQCRNPIGLGAGFDKNARYLRELEALGFGFVEIGTVTPLAQEGNPKPRLFRLPSDKALINRMGFNNDGAEKIASRLKKWNENRTGLPGKPRFLVGGNIGKNKQTPNEDAWKDYLICFNSLHPYVDYFVVNVSSPNTPGLRALQDKESLRAIFSALNLANEQQPTPKPILLKIAPDLEIAQVDDVIALLPEINLEGLIVSNTTISRNGLKTASNQVAEIGAGGLSGLPLLEKSTAMLKYIHEKTQGKLLLIGSGGIFNGPEAKAKLDAGASLIQVWTGFVYEGPAIVKNISAYLAAINK